MKKNLANNSYDLFAFVLVSRVPMVQCQSSVKL
jgi:hypothetical protein